MRSHRMIFRHDERFGQWHVPRLRAYVPHESGYFIVRTNGEGMRDSRDHPARPAAGRTRILLFGDSFTAGEGVHNEERFSDLLERMLPGTEVLNFGLDGTGPDQQLLIFEEFSPRFGGDLILFCPGVENIRRAPLSHWPVMDRTTGQMLLIPKPYFTLENGLLCPHQLPVPRARLSLSDAPPALRQQLGLDRDRSGLARRLAGRVLRWSGHQPFPQYDSPESPAWLLVRALLRRLTEQAGSRKVVLAPLPIYHYVEGLTRPTYRERFKEFVRDHPQVAWVDLLPAFQALTPTQRRRCRFPKDVHYTPFAHSLVARALAQALAPLVTRSSPVPVREYA